MEWFIGFIKPKVNKLFSTGFFHIFGSNVINKILSFFSSVILVRLLSKTEYGVFISAWNIYSIVLLFNGAGMVSGILQMCSEKASDTEYVKSIVKFGTMAGLAADIILACVMGYIALFVPLSIKGTSGILFLLCFLPIAQFLYDAMQAYLRALKDNKTYSRLSIMNTALYACFSIVGALLFKEKGLVLGHYFACILTVLFGLYTIKSTKIIRYKECPIKADIITIFKISFVSMINNGISQLLYLLDIFVLGIVSADEAILASYKVATTIPAAFIFIPLCMVTYIYPYFAEHREDGRWCLRQYKRIILGVGTINFFIAAVLFLFADPVIFIVFGEKYLDIVPIFRILAVNYFVSGTFRIISGNLLITQRCLKFNSFVAIVSGIVNVVCDYFFIIWWGMIGAAFATIAVVVVSSLLSTTYLVRQFREKVVQCCD